MLVAGIRSANYVLLSLPDGGDRHDMELRAIRVIQPRNRRRLPYPGFARSLLSNTSVDNKRRVCIIAPSYICWLEARDSQLMAVNRKATKMRSMIAEVRWHGGWKPAFMNAAGWFGGH